MSQAGNAGGSGGGGGGGSLNTLSPDSGTPVTAVANNIQIKGGTNINTTSPGAGVIAVNLNAQIQQPDGTAAAPSYSFSGDPTTGVYRDSGGNLGFGVGNGERVKVTGQALQISVNTQLFAGFIGNYQSITTTPFAPDNSYYYMGVDTTSAKTIQFPNSPSAGQTYIVKDKTGNAQTNNITVTTVGGTVLIDGATTYVLTTNYESASFIFNGTGWEVY